MCFIVSGLLLKLSNSLKYVDVLARWKVTFHLQKFVLLKVLENYFVCAKKCFMLCPCAERQCSNDGRDVAVKYFKAGFN